MADVMFGPLAYFKKYILTNHWNSEETIKDVNMPIAFISGSKDELVPEGQMERLKKAAEDGFSGASRHFYKFKEGTHNDTWFHDKAKYL